MENVRESLQASLPNNRIASRHSNLFVNYLRNIRSHFQFRRPKRYQDREDNRVFKPELESASIADNSTLLLPNKNIHRRNRRISGCKESKKTGKTTREITTKGKQTVMPTQTLQAQHYIYFSYNIRSRFRHRIKFYVESELPVDTHVVDDIGFQDFLNGRQFEYYGGFKNKTEHRQELRVPYEGMWYLIIQNTQYQNVAIHYEVYD